MEPLLCVTIMPRRAAHKHFVLLSSLADVQTVRLLLSFLWSRLIFVLDLFAAFLGYLIVFVTFQVVAHCIMLVQQKLEGRMLYTVSHFCLVKTGAKVSVLQDC